MNFFKNIINHLIYGDEAPNIVGGKNRYDTVLFSSACHQGPLEEALKTACDESKVLLLYVYSKYRYSFNEELSVFNSDEIVDRINGFVFYPVSITSYEGLSLIRQYKFVEAPLIAVISCAYSENGEMNVSAFAVHNGPFTSTDLLSYLSMEEIYRENRASRNRHNNTNGNNDNNQSVPNRED